MTLKNFRSSDFKTDGEKTVKIVRSTKDVRLTEKVEVSKPIIAVGASPEDVPAGTVKEILTWVSEDVVRAQKALDVEVSADKPRSGLVSSLTNLIDAEAVETVPTPPDDSDF